MIKGITIANGKLRLILVGDTPLDKEILKSLDGATVTTIKDNLKVFEQSVSEGLVLEVVQKDQK